jgi:hypothetical protein
MRNSGIEPRVAALVIAAWLTAIASLPLRARMLDAWSPSLTAHAEGLEALARGRRLLARWDPACEGALVAARAALERAHRERGDEPLVLGALGETHLLLNRPGSDDLEVAQRLLERSFAARPRGDVARLLAGVLERRGDGEGSYGWRERATALRPEWKEDGPPGWISVNGLTNLARLFVTMVPAGSLGRLYADQWLDRIAQRAGRPELREDAVLRHRLAVALEDVLRTEAGRFKTVEVLRCRDRHLLEIAGAYGIDRRALALRSR